MWLNQRTRFAVSSVCALALAGWLVASTDCRAADIQTADHVASDYNGNGIVDAADYTLWRDSYGKKGLDLLADGNRDRIVDAADYEIWKNQFGDEAKSDTNENKSSLAIPEPAGMLLVFMLLLVASMWRWFDLRATANRH